MKQLIAVGLFAVLTPLVAARGYATDDQCRAAEKFLENAPAVAVIAQTFYLDGGSIQYTVQSAASERFKFVLSNDGQRQDPAKFLSLYDGRIIRLVPDKFYDRLTTLLRRSLTAGLESDLQKAVPEFTSETEALVALLSHPGSAHDLDPLHELASARIRAATARRRQANRS